MSGTGPEGGVSVHVCGYEGTTAPAAVNTRMFLTRNGPACLPRSLPACLPACPPACLAPLPACLAPPSPPPPPCLSLTHWLAPQVSAAPLPDCDPHVRGGPAALCSGGQGHQQGSSSNSRTGEPPPQPPQPQVQVRNRTLCVCALFDGTNVPCRLHIGMDRSLPTCCGCLPTFCFFCLSSSCRCCCCPTWLLQHPHPHRAGACTSPQVRGGGRMGGRRPINLQT